MKILLLYPEVGIGIRWTELLQTGILGAMIRQARHKLSLIHYKHPTQIPAIEQFAEKFEPDLIVANVSWDQWEYAQPLLGRVRQAAPKPMLVVAGVYPTLDPGKVIQDSAVDAVLVGEIEPALEDLVQRLAMRQNCTDTPNFWFKSRENGVLKNALRPLVPDLDILPFTDRTLYDHAALVQASGGGFPMLASRSCPHNCLFCYMPRLKQIASGKGAFVRPRGPMSLCAEVHHCAKEERIEWIDFVDEHFPQNIDWLTQFCAQWKVQVRLPFRFTAVAERLTPESLVMLRDAGCAGIRLGLETGDEKFRARIADRNLSNQRLKGICDEARKLGIEVALHSMIGLPLENPDLAHATVKLNELLHPAEARVSIFKPIIDTPLHQFCRDNGYMKAGEETPPWTSRHTTLQLPAITDQQVLEAYDAMQALNRRLQLEQAGTAEGYLDLTSCLEQAKVESPVAPPLSLGNWSREQDTRFCLLQAAGSKAVFPVQLQEESALEFSIAQGPCPFGIRFPRAIQVDIRLRQGEYEDVLFAFAVEMSSKKSRRGWFDVRLPLLEWPAGPAELVFTATPLGALPVAPVYVAWARPRLTHGSSADSRSANGQSSKKIRFLEDEVQRLQNEMETLRSQLHSTREDLDQRRQRVGELHLQILEQEKELDALRAERQEWTRLRDEIEKSMGEKLKRFFKKD